MIGVPPALQEAAKEHGGSAPALGPVEFQWRSYFVALAVVEPQAFKSPAKEDPAPGMRPPALNSLLDPLGPPMPGSDAGDERAKARELFGRLFATERALPPMSPPSDDPAQREQRRQCEGQRRQLRRRDSEPVWDELSKWMAEQKPGALPKSPLGTAIGYASNNGDCVEAIPGARPPGHG